MTHMYIMVALISQNLKHYRLKSTVFAKVYNVHNNAWNQRISNLLPCDGGLCTFVCFNCHSLIYFWFLFRKEKTTEVTPAPARAEWFCVHNSKFIVAILYFPLFALHFWPLTLFVILHYNFLNKCVSIQPPYRIWVYFILQQIFPRIDEYSAWYINDTASQGGHPGTRGHP